jgi:hypothetical protein
MMKHCVPLAAAASTVVVVTLLGGTPLTPEVRAQGASAAGWSLARTPWGHPDLQGTFSSDDMRGVPMQRPQEFGDRRYLTDEEFAERERRNEAELDRLAAGGTLFLSERGVRTFRQTSLIVDPPDGQLPALTADGERRNQAAANARRNRPAGPEDRSYYDRCISRGVVGSILPVVYGNGLQIMQAPDLVAIRYEMIHETRVIPLDGRPFADPGFRSYMGDARGRWEGDTLVVETRNLLGRTGVGLNGGGAPTTQELTLVERFTRVSEDQIDYEVTVTDPGTFTRPFTMAFPITTQPDYEILPYECHEGNFALPNILSAARAEERAEADALARGLPLPRSSWLDGQGASVFAPPAD